MAIQERVLVILVFLVGVLGAPARAQTEEPVRPWWVGFEAGEGQLRFTSDQSAGSRMATFALGFTGGRNLGSRARIGIQVNGWLLQAFSLNDPTVGESVSNTLFITDAFPIPKRPLFVRGGAGWASYTNNRPNGFGGSGWAWTAGAGYEIPITRRLRLAPMLAYNAGTLGNSPGINSVETRRRYSVIEFRVELICPFGKPMP
jgi:hypothetical protein